METLLEVSIAFRAISMEMSVECPKLEGTHQDQSPTPVGQQDNSTVHTVCRRTLVSLFVITVHLQYAPSG